MKKNLKSLYILIFGLAVIIVFSLSTFGNKVEANDSILEAAWYTTPIQSDDGDKIGYLRYAFDDKFNFVYETTISHSSVSSVHIVVNRKDLQGHLSSYYSLIGSSKGIRDINLRPLVNRGRGYILDIYGTIYDSNNVPYRIKLHQSWIML